MQEVKGILLDKDYKPQMGDVLYLEGEHPFAMIQGIYVLDRYGMRKDKDFNKKMIRHEVLHKIIRRKEIIWSQHREDFEYFPNNIREDHPRYYYLTSLSRDSMSYNFYCSVYKQREHQRLYNSKYYYEPVEKIRTKIGERTMITVNHSFCRSNIDIKDGVIVMGKQTGQYWYGLCSYYGSKRSLPLSHYINNQYRYIGNVYLDVITNANKLVGIYENKPE